MRPMPHAPRIETDRLILRRWHDSDHAPFAGICADPQVMRYIGDGSVRTADETSAVIDRFERNWDARGFGLFAVESRATGDLIGFAGFSVPEFLPEILPSVEIGWRLARSCWGQGLASEAARAVLAYGLSDLGLRDIVSICRPGNRASERVMQKIGLVADRETTDPAHGLPVLVYRLPVSRIAGQSGAGFPPAQ